ncbi:hypothetical protein TB2_019046 [Malus domestica]
MAPQREWGLFGAIGVRSGYEPHGKRCFGEERLWVCKRQAKELHCLEPDLEVEAETYESGQRLWCLWCYG